PAFRSAVFLTAEVVELDVRQTEDGRWVCFHDDTLDRTTDAAAVLNRKGLKPEERTLLELRRLDAGAWKEERFAGIRIPTLDEALDAILPRATPLIERKTGSAESLARFLRERELLDRVVVQSFDHDFVAEFRRHAPEAALGALGSGEMTLDQIARFEEIDVDLVHWRAKDLSVETLRVLRKRGFLTMVYTVNDDVGFAGAAALGISGITTDDPNRLRGRIKAGFARRVD
ncbi:MAG: glycerophosphodiester phosphodiesterase, partial [Planctomycetota bacterium JB042]